MESDSIPCEHCRGKITIYFSLNIMENEVNAKVVIQISP